ncbi:MotA/TolQ/ExbB proton channel family protein [uncultured Methanobrevibacter sp.]|uniref:MotA/TolQ/ExbB proton channel family protein n=1 Tax=uncultured Methanobrevibacter sp. TaxID=253161 RepID=UPI0025E4D34A|nr:MotA/TolQ/ExbB proton channel family protein [uncultured Methanobrevibacter sp.]
MIIQGTEALTSLIHIISESLLTPVVIILVIFVVLSILCLGGVINEKISRKPIKSEEFEKLVRDISFSNSPSEIENFVNDGSLFDWQKDILVKIARNHDIGSKARQALASELISNAETILIKSTNKTDILVRLGPIFGLLGTLIPLGPGLAALGSGDITTLAESLTIAFDTTVTGLAVGGIGYLISKFRKQWYESDLIDVETLAEVELESLNNQSD